MGCQPDNVAGRTGPEDDAVPLIAEVGVRLEFQQMLVDGEACEVVGEELGLLLGIAPCAVGIVQRANLILRG